MNQAKPFFTLITAQDQAVAPISPSGYNIALEGGDNQGDEEMTDEHQMMPETRTTGHLETNISDLKQDVRNINERIVSLAADTAGMNAKLDGLNQLIKSELGGAAKLLESKLDSLDKHVNAKIDGVKSNKTIIVCLLIALLAAMAPAYFPTIKEMIENLQLRSPIEINSAPNPSSPHPRLLPQFEIEPEPRH
jgi:hypothetical protein